MSQATNGRPLIQAILLQVALAFAIGVAAAFAALALSRRQPDLPFSGFLVASPLLVLPIAVLALINLRRAAQAKPPFNVTLFLFAALAGEICGPLAAWLAYDGLVGK